MEKFYIQDGRWRFTHGLEVNDDTLVVRVTTSALSGVTLER